MCAFTGTNRFAQSREPTDLRTHWNPRICAVKGAHRFAHSREPTDLRIQRNPQAAHSPTTSALTGTHKLRSQGRPQSCSLRGLWSKILRSLRFHRRQVDRVGLSNEPGCVHRQQVDRVCLSNAAGLPIYRWNQQGEVCAGSETERCADQRE